MKLLAQIKNNFKHSIYEKCANDSWEGLEKELGFYSNISVVNGLTLEVRTYMLFLLQVCSWEYINSNL